MINKDIKLGLNDISIQPCVLSDIKSRSDCVPYDEYGMLPLFTAPMDTVVDENNYMLYKKNKINSIIPRTIPFKDRVGILKNGEWVAFGLEECENYFLGTFIDANDIEKPNYYYDFYDKNDFYGGMSNFSESSFKILIDIANGHMKHLYEVVSQIKKILPNSKIMVGNIANPETYRYCCQQGVDYVRVGIGGGSGCITSSNTSIHYPMASLINECYKISCEFNNPTKIIADGGMKNYSDIIKAFALGSDYVMCGGLFAKMLETPGEVKFISDKGGHFHNRDITQKVNQYQIDFSCLEEGDILEKQFYGMASKKAQKLMGKNKLKTSEGKVKTIKIEYTMGGWVENFTHYLRSAMSYCGKRSLEKFIGNVNIIKLSNNASNAFNK